MRKLSVLACLLAVFALGFVPASADEAKEKKKSLLQGTWKRVSGSEEVSTMKFTGNKFEVHMEQGGQKAAFKGTFTLDDSKKPKTIDLKISSGPREQFIGKSALGIFKIVKGKLTWCSTAPGQENRPADFEKRDGVLIVTLEKQKKKEKKEKK